jgi:hypothetical protein
MCLLFLTLFLFGAGVVHAQDYGIEDPLVLDDFYEDPSWHPDWFPKLRSVVMGYGVYYDSAEASLSRVAVGKDVYALRIEYDVPPLHDWGNWLSIRREFDSVLDLSDCKALRLGVRVRVPSDAKLRITLADVVDLDNRRKDEMWWFDFGEGVLSRAEGEWQTLTVPLKRFYKSYGEGTRHNDGKLDLSKITAYEINIVSKSGTHPAGTFDVKSLVAY